MVESTDTQISTRLYAGRLRDVDQVRLKAEGFAEAFDESTGKLVWAAFEKKGRNHSLSALPTIQHAHLAPVVDVVDHEDGWLVLTQVFSGTTLRARLAEIGRKHAVDAVRTALRVADALSRLHDAGLTHGRVNPDNVLLALDQGVEPALLFGVPSPAEYLRPERDPDSADFDPRDDTWAATALLYFMLTGSPPPRKGLRDVSALEELRIDDTLLRDVLAHGLAELESERAKNLTALKRELARWFIAHAADEPVPVGNFSHKPPPLPPSVPPSGGRKARRSHRPRPEGSPAPHAAESQVTSTRRGWIRSLPLAVVAAVVGIAVAWGVSLVTKSTTKSVIVREQAVAASALPAASAGPIDLAEVPVTGKEQSAGDPTTTCARAYLRDGTLAKSAQLDAICREAELPRALGTLRLAFASTAGPAPATAARFDGLGWYSLPLLAALRKACCTDPPALKLPDLGDACPDFGTRLDELAHVASTTQQFDLATEKYSEAARCAVRTGRASGISNAPPTAITERAFRELFAAAGNP